MEDFRDRVTIVGFQGDHIPVDDDQPNFVTFVEVNHKYSMVRPHHSRAAMVARHRIELCMATAR
jgi:hypothetical protein